MSDILLQIRTLVLHFVICALWTNKMKKTTVVITTGALAVLTYYLYSKYHNNKTESSTTFVPSTIIKSKSVLILGDGNLSYSLATVKLIRNVYWKQTTDLLISTYDTLDELHERYPNDPIDEIISELNKGVSGIKVTVAQKVDATQLTTSLNTVRSNNTKMNIPLQFDLILFNFPHWGGRGYIQRNRKLLKNFFRSVQESNILAPQGEIHLALKQGQGGTPIDMDLKASGNTWKTLEAAAASGFILADVSSFTVPNGYYCSGRRGNFTFLIIFVVVAKQ